MGPRTVDSEMMSISKEDVDDEKNNGLMNDVTMSTQGGGRENGTPRVLAAFVSDVDDGGAGIACGRIFTELSRSPCDSSRWIVAQKRRKTQATNASIWPSFSSLMAFELKRRLLQGEGNIIRAIQRFSEINVGRIVRKANPRIVCLHNLHQKMSFSLLAKLPRNIPITIYLHDMWYLTGYCCYNMGCDKYLTGCHGECPQWGKWEVPLYPTDKMFRVKQDFYLRNAHRIRIIAPSKWMAQCAESRFGGAIPVEIIGNPIDCELYTPVGEKRLIKQMLGFDADKPLILCGAVSMRDTRKGARYIAESIKLLHARLGGRFTVALFGKPCPEIQIPGAIWLGMVQGERLLNLYYNAASVFFLPSLAESFGMVYAEAMAAGTPCVAFDVTACGELVKEGETGFLAGFLDVEELANALTRAIQAEDGGVMAQTCRQHVMDRYNCRKIARQHLDLIETMVGAQKGEKES